MPCMACRRRPCVDRSRRRRGETRWKLQRRRRRAAAGSGRARTRRRPLRLGYFERDVRRCETSSSPHTAGARRCLSSGEQQQCSDHRRFLLKNSSVLVHASVAAFVVPPRRRVVVETVLRGRRARTSRRSCRSPSADGLERRDARTNPGVDGRVRIVQHHRRHDLRRVFRARLASIERRTGIQIRS